MATLADISVFKPTCSLLNKCVCCSKDLAPRKKNLPNNTTWLEWLERKMGTFINGTDGKEMWKNFAVHYGILYCLKSLKGVRRGLIKGTFSEFFPFRAIYYYIVETNVNVTQIQSKCGRGFFSTLFCWKKRQFILMGHCFLHMHYPI